VSFHDGAAHRGPLTLEADVVIVGSGAGGAVVAAILAEAGQRVLVLEEGRHVPQSEYSKLSASQQMRAMWRDAGLTFAVGVGDSPMINVMMGKCVGGSSTLTGGVCFRVPPNVLASWRNERGLPISR
jgi:choline dehydrogenase-like flavoprotein